MPALIFGPQPVTSATRPRNRIEALSGIMLAREHAGCPHDTYSAVAPEIRTASALRRESFSISCAKGFGPMLVTTISRAAICARMSGLLSTPETVALTRSTILEDILAGPASVSRE